MPTMTLSVSGSNPESHATISYTD
ncbi:MAG: hypothetical protein QOI90_2213, partial [Mycobacterium sp.]|nr:hypothetical protein [Mycobacterium sp.]